MAFQSQTFSNSNNAYYVTNQVPIVPGDQTNLAAPIEIQNNDLGNDAYFSRIVQNDATGLTITENSTNTVGVNFGELMRFRMNPTGNNGPGANIGPQITFAAATQAPNLLMTSSLTEVFGTFAIGTKLNQGDLNPLTVNYSTTPFPNTTITQGAVGISVNKLEMNLNSVAADGNVAITVKNPTGAGVLSTQTATITPNLIQIAQSSVLSPQASLSFVGGQAAVSATTSNKTTYMIANSSGNGAVVADNSLFLTTNVGDIVGGPKSVFQGNTDGTSLIPLKMYGPYASTITSESRIETTSTFIANNAQTGFLSIVNTGNPADINRNVPFDAAKLTWNTLITPANLRLAPVSTMQSLEINNTSQGPERGGIQFFCGNNTDIPNPKWMGGFIQSIPVSEFRLASTVTASLPQLTNVSTINTIPINNFGVPVGTVLPWAGGQWDQNPMPVPDGYLLCDGREFVVSTNPQLAQLYSVIGTRYGGGILPERFNIPATYGRALMGAVTTDYEVRVTVQSLVSVSLPTGGTRLGIYVTAVDTGFILGDRKTDTQLYVGMFGVGISGGVIQKIIGSAANNDGVASNNQFYPPYVILLTGDAVVSGPFPTGITFKTNSPAGNQNSTYFPHIGSDYNSPGAGFNYMTQQTEQVGYHNHGSLATGSTNNASAASGRSEPNFSTPYNAGLYTYTDPVTSTSVTAPSAHMIMPANVGFNMIIKF